MEHSDRSILRFIDENQISFSRTLLIFLYGLHFLNANSQSITNKFLHLQHQTGVNDQGEPIYDIGWDDIFIIIHVAILLTFLRCFLMKWVWGPFAGNILKMGHKAKIRFAEQSWSFTCYFISFVSGVLIFIYSPYFGDLDNVYRGWPHDDLPGYFKGYYLIALGFWFQQILVLNIEEKRKDHYQMFSHHIITCCLLTGSYYYYYTRIGNLILVIMDGTDIFLSGAKLLKYAGFNTLCDITFVLFLISWIVCRHGLYNYLFHHAWYKALDLMADGKCVEGVIQKRCWSPMVVNTFYGLLAGLQVITIIWVYFIAKVAYKVITGTGAEDVRSDSEDDDEEEEEEEKENGKDGKGKEQGKDGNEKDGNEKQQDKEENHSKSSNKPTKSTKSTDKPTSK